MVVTIESTLYMNTAPVPLNDIIAWKDVNDLLETFILFIEVEAISFYRSNIYIDILEILILGGGWVLLNSPERGEVVRVSIKTF